MRGRRRAGERTGRDAARRGRPRPEGDPRGFSLLELLIVLVIIALATTVALGGYGAFRQSTVVSRAAERVAGDVALTHSYAVQRREHVSLVADEADRSYRIRTPAGVVLAARSYAAETDLPLTLLDVRTTGDSITFDGRGMRVRTGTAEIDVGRFDRSRRVLVNTVGRTRITSP